MLRITTVTPPGRTPAILLEGRLVGPWVTELHRLTLERDDHPATRLDLAGLTFAAGDGVALLRALRAKGFELCAASSFLAALIGGDDGGTRELA